MTKYTYNSLEDFLQSKPLDVDGLLDDGFGAIFPVKGRIIDAAILFADVANFSERTQNLSPIETMIFVNNFFSWVTAEALQEKKGIVDKYIGDEMMVVFSKDFGSEDPFLDAVTAARWMAERDHIGYFPHLGIAAGTVVVGYVGTPLKYNCSVYGLPVTLARACCRMPAQGKWGASMIFPAKLWEGREFEKVFIKRKVWFSETECQEVEVPRKPLPARKEKLKTGESIDVVEIARETAILTPRSAENRAQESYKGLVKDGSYRPRRYGFEPTPVCFKAGPSQDVVKNKPDSF